ncbi:ATP-dependent zinc metalloprotease FtsH 3 [Luteitalea pratensis]|uniref:ATP-dependent zinc metalloprotease FtsH 3 n=1 Tax=Luteitalea pratensis TaxID=1855912 RepID=A0A143PKU4_LUTPR|nr:ATP-binding protein [Luteitalea pratensis]AMY08414.1 ATP-dependent zinc metalloprotease FtsH 3 [Luteitalea pratensis]
MMDVGAWRAHNDAWLATAVHWLRLRLEVFIAGGQGDGTELDALAERLREAETSEPPPALVLLSQAFGLSVFERHVLLLGVASALDTGMAHLFARAQDNPSQPHPTFALALALFDAPEWEALSVTRPLRYWRLIELSAHGAVPVTLAPLRADERIVHFAKGLNTIDERLLPVLVPASMPALPLPASQQDIADMIAQRHAATGRVLVQLAGPNRSSKASVAAAAATAEGCQLRGLLPEALSQPPAEAETFVRLFQRERRLLPLALLVDLHDTDPTPLQIATVTRLASSEADAIGGSVFVSVREASRALSADALLVDVTTPTAEEQHDRWAEVAVPGRGCDGAARLAAQFDFDTAEIDRIADLASAGHGAPPACTALWRASVAFARPRLNGLAQRIDARATWKDIVLPPDAIRLLQHLAEQVRYRHQVHERWGWRARSARGLGVTALFAGESGTGKTMAAEVLAADLQLDLYRIDLSSIVSKYIGETEKNLREVFDAAEHGGALLLFDEADALFGKRSEVKDSHDRYANIETSYLLQRLESFDGLAILATNLRSNVDAAFVRRLRFIVPFPFPGQAERRAMWARAFPAATPVRDIDVDRLARLTVTGAAIHGIALTAAFMAAARDQAVDMALIREAARLEMRKREQPTNEVEAL